MAYTIQRIGKSLVKYFKPVRVAPPHVPNDPRFTGAGKSDQGLGNDSPDGFQLLKFKKPERDKFAESREKIRAGIVDETALEPLETQLPDRAPAQWLDLVVGLLAACRRVSQKMKKRIGVQAYRTAAAAKGRSQLKTLGSIVDATPDDTRETG